MILEKIREILENKNLDIADKICEIEKLLPEKKETTNFLGANCEVRREGNAIIFDGSIGVEYVDNPRLKNEDDIFYIGCGCTFDTDLDGKRYWKRYHSMISGDRFSHLNHGDIIDEKARIKKIVKECLNEL